MPSYRWVWLPEDHCSNSQHRCSEGPRAVRPKLPLRRQEDQGHAVGTGPVPASPRCSPPRTGPVRPFPSGSPAHVHQALVRRPVRRLKAGPRGPAEDGGTGVAFRTGSAGEGGTDGPEARGAGGHGPEDPGRGGGPRRRRTSGPGSPCPPTRALCGQ